MRGFQSGGDCVINHCAGRRRVAPGPKNQGKIGFGRDADILSKTVSEFAIFCRVVKTAGRISKIE
jgi:hypothetical protein